MLEIPEALTISRQLHDVCVGKRIVSVIAAQHPHKFTWYCGDPAAYPSLLSGRMITVSSAYGGMIEIQAEDATLLFSDGVNLRFYPAGQEHPDKHQLHLQFDDGSSLIASVQMYGGVCAFPAGSYENKYYTAAKAKPTPLSDTFSHDYFNDLFKASSDKLSAKAFLATEQRIPGLGNGVLQDILWNAKIHPKRKLASLSEEEKNTLYHAVKTILSKMAEQGGRDTEHDLFGSPGGYKTVLCRNAELHLCPDCGGPVAKEAYMGGSIYFCKLCQKF